MGIGIDDTANKHYNLQINCVLNNALVNSYVFNVFMRFQIFLITISKKIRCPIDLFTSISHKVYENLYTLTYRVFGFL